MFALHVLVWILDMVTFKCLVAKKVFRCLIDPICGPKKVKTSTTQKIQNKDAFSDMNRKLFHIGHEEHYSGAALGEKLIKLAQRSLYYKQTNMVSTIKKENLD